MTLFSLGVVLSTAAGGLSAVGGVSVAAGVVESAGVVEADGGVSAAPGGGSTVVVADALSAGVDSVGSGARSPVQLMLSELWGSGGKSRAALALRDATSVDSLFGADAGAPWPGSKFGSPESSPSLGKSPIAESEPVAASVATAPGGRSRMPPRRPRRPRRRPRRAPPSLLGWVPSAASAPPEAFG